MHFWSSGPVPVQTEAEAYWYLNLTADQQSAYDKFRVHLADGKLLLEGHDDQWTLLRFLKARQWDVERAVQMYNTMTKWRKEHKPDELHRTYVFHELDTVFQHYPHFFHKTDKYGRPLYIELLGKTDPAKLLEVTTLERLLDYHICEWEELKARLLPACSTLRGRPIITKSVVLDLKGVSLKNFGSAAQRILKTIAHVDQDYYPEHLGQMFIINTPTVFRAIWAFVNPMLEERTRRKIVILGSDYLPTLVQLVPLDSLPELLGGTSKIDDMKVSVGPWTELLAAQSQEATALAKQMSEPISHSSSAVASAPDAVITSMSEPPAAAQESKAT